MSISRTLLSSETVHDLVSNLSDSFDMLSLVEIYTLGEYGWSRVASSRNYNFQVDDTALFEQFISEHRLHKVNFENDAFINFCESNSHYFYMANLVPTFDNSQVAFVISGSTDESENQLKLFIEHLLPILRNLHKLHNSNKQMQSLNQKNAEQEIALSRITSLLDSAGDAIYYHDAKGRILDFNQQAIISSGYDKSELYAKHLKDIDIDVSNSISLNHLIKDKVKPGEPVTIQSIHLRKDGSKFPVEVTISLHDNGNYLSVVRDISKRMTIQKELEDAQAFLKSIIDVSESVLYVQDLEVDKIISGCYKINKFLGLPEGTVKSVTDFIPMLRKDQKEDVIASYKKAIKSQFDDVHIYEHQLQLHSGEWIWLKTSVTVGEREQSGKAAKLYMSSTDITHYKNLELSLVDSQKKYVSLIENAFDAILVVNQNQNISFASSSVYRIFNYDIGDSKDLKIDAFIHVDDLSKLREAWGYILENPAEPYVINSIRINVKDSSYKWTKVTLNNLLSDPNVSGVVINISDISAEVAAKSKAEQKERYYKTLVESSHDGIVLFDQTTRLVFVSDSTRKMLGYESSDEFSLMVADHVHEDDLDEVRTLVLNFLLRPFSTVDLPEYRLKKKDGSYIWVQNTLSNFIDDPNISGVISNFRDITSRKTNEQTLYKLSNFDSLTGLPNRKYLIEQLKQFILKAKTSKSQFGLVIFDIDSLNAINTAHGHIIGDEIIKNVGKIIQSVVSPSEFVAKTGDDEFAILIENQSTYAVSRITQNVIEQFKPLIKVNDSTVKVTLNAGISIFPKDAISDKDLISYAEIALKSSKQNVEPFAFYKNYDSEYTKYRLGLENDLTEAISNDQLRIVYQPVVEAGSGKIHCLEALLRWQHPKSGNVEPSLFIQIAEKSDLISQLSNWVISTVIKQIAEWNKVGLTPTVAVNLSPLDIRRKNLNHFVTDTLGQYKVEPTSLIFEITESNELLDPQFAISQMQDLKQSGIEFILDDFGTGFSSVSHLLNLPISGAKIDQSFIANAIADHGDNAKDFLYGMINLIRGSGIKAVVEGIETDEQYQLVSGFEQLYLQGYLLSKPLEVDQLTSLLSTDVIINP